MGQNGSGTSGAPVERFPPTSGQVTGVLALVLVAAVVVTGLVDPARGFSLPVVAGALVVGVLVWAAMLRPRVWATEEDLVMRNMMHTAWIPLASIEQVVVRQVLAVSAGEKRYVSPAVGRSRRQTLRPDLSRAAGAAEASTGSRAPSYPDFVEDRIGRLAEEARAARGIRRRSDEQRALAAGVRRRWAWPELVALVAAGTLLVLSLVR